MQVRISLSGHFAEEKMELNKDTLPRYLQERHTEIAYFAADAELVAAEIGNGNLNFVYRVFDAANPKCSLIVKQAPPYIKILGPAYPLTTQRLTYEFRALESYHRLAAGAAPAPHYFDAENAVIVMEDLGGYHLLRDALIAGNVSQAVPMKIGRFLGRVHRATRAEERERFDNAAMQALTAEYVFTLPFTAHETNFYTAELTDKVARLKADEAFLQKARLLKAIFLTEQQGLTHGDLHTGSVMARGDSAKVIDAEFAFYGPVGFDIGLFWANYGLSYFSHIGNAAVQSALKTALVRTWESYAAAFQTGGKRETLEHIFHTAVGFAGMEVLRRIIGAAHVKDIEGIADARRKLRAETAALDFGATLVKDYERIASVTELCARL